MAMSVQKPICRLLLVEDNLSDIALASRYLENSDFYHFELTVGRGIQQAMDFLKAAPFDIILLDLGLPDSHGLERLSQMLKVAGPTPIVVLTGYSSDTLGVEAIRMGAQDYLPKGSIQAAQLVRSIAFAMERSKERSAAPNAQVVDSDFSIDIEKQTVSVVENNSPRAVNLTSIEFRILLYLMKNKTNTLTRGQIVSAIWRPEDHEISFRTVDRHISSLKKKSRIIDNRITSIYGVGYRFE